MFWLFQMRMSRINVVWISTILGLIIIIVWYSGPTNEEEKYDYTNYIQLKLLEAESIWRKGFDDRHTALLQSPRPENNSFSHSGYRVIWDFFYPNYNCPHDLERLGRVGDGGKWVCGISHIKKQKKPCVVYSYGIAGETSFEKDILDRTNCTIHAYDHTVKNVDLPKLYPTRATWSKIGIGINNTNTLRTLKTEMDSRGHTFMEILKLDVEGAEFKVLEQIQQDFPTGLPFGQLIIELHLAGLPKIGMFKLFLNWWEKLEEAGLRAFHNEPNLYVSAMSVEKREMMWYEYSFLNVKVPHSLLED